jgi:hypothetical protein
MFWSCEKPGAKSRTAKGPNHWPIRYGGGPDSLAVLSLTGGERELEKEKGSPDRTLLRSALFLGKFSKLLTEQACFVHASGR